eukprot:SAG31_NODE_24727_length_475_cov_0.960106_1_plen_129_part_10
MLERHYVYEYCSPTRSALLSGRLPVHVNTINEAPTATSGGVHLGMSTIAEVLAAPMAAPRRIASAIIILISYFYLQMLTGVGYAAHQVGKWNVGSSTHAHLPVARGFISSLGYMGGMEVYIWSNYGQMI